MFFSSSMQIVTREGNISKRFTEEKKKEQVYDGT